MCDAEMILGSSVSWIITLTPYSSSNAFRTDSEYRWLSAYRQIGIFFCTKSLWKWGNEMTSLDAFSRFPFCHVFVVFNYPTATSPAFRLTTVADTSLRAFTSMAVDNNRWTWNTSLSMRISGVSISVSKTNQQTYRVWMSTKDMITKLC